MAKAPRGQRSLKIRPAAPADVPRLVELINAAFSVEKFFVDRDRTNTDEIGALMQTGTFLLGVDHAGRTAACVYVERRGQRGYFGLLSVDPTRQGAGLGGQMIRAVEALFRRAGCVALDIRVVNLRSELPPIYRKLGYIEVGTEPFTDPKAFKPCHFIVMSKPLLSSP